MAIVYRGLSHIPVVKVINSFQLLFFLIICQIQTHAKSNPPKKKTHLNVSKSTAKLPPLYIISASLINGGSTFHYWSKFKSNYIYIFIFRSQHKILIIDQYRTCFYTSNYSQQLNSVKCLVHVDHDLYNVMRGGQKILI